MSVPLPAHVEAAIRQTIETLKLPASERTQEKIHLCAVLLTDHLRAFSSKLPYNNLCDACRGLSYSRLDARIRMTDDDDTGQTVFRILLSGSVRVQRKFGPKAWLPIGFLRAGDILGLPAMLSPSPDDIRYTTLGDRSDGGCEFAVLRRFEFERCLRTTYEESIRDNVKLLQRTPSFSSLPEATLKQLVSCSRHVSLGPGELLTREGEATDELFILKSGLVRLVKSLRTRETCRWPTDKVPSDESESESEEEEEEEEEGEEGGEAVAEKTKKRIKRPKLYRETATIRRSRMVIVSEIREGSPFAHDEAIAVIRRIASARASKSSIPFRDQPPIRRNVTSFCMSTVQAIAISPITLMVRAWPPQRRASCFLLSFTLALTHPPPLPTSLPHTGLPPSRCLAAFYQILRRSEGSEDARQAVTAAEGMEAVQGGAAGGGESASEAADAFDGGYGAEEVCWRSALCTGTQCGGCSW